MGANQMEGYYAKYDSWACYKAKLIFKILKILPGFGEKATITYGSAENENGMEGTWLVGALIEIMHSAAVVEAANDGTNTEMTGVKKTGNDNKFLPYFLIFLVAFVIAAISFCYVFTSRTKGNTYAAPSAQETAIQA